MALLGLLVWPAIVVGAVALVSRHVLQRRDVPSPGRVGVGGVVSGALLAAALATAIAVGMDDGYYVECGGSSTRWWLALAHFGGLAPGGSRWEALRRSGRRPGDCSLVTLCWQWAPSS